MPVAFSSDVVGAGPTSSPQSSTPDFPEEDPPKEALDLTRTRSVFEHKMTPEMALPPAFPRSGEVVHLSAGPPCQPYSKAGKGEGQEDPRDGIPAVLEAIEELMPLMVEIENVPEIQKYEGVVDSIVSRLNSLGYWVSRGVLVASDYGVPQSRRRFFVVGSLLGPMGLPEPTTADRPITVEEAIGSGTDLNAFRILDTSSSRSRRKGTCVGCARLL
ncbi:hypothetical protein AB1Y20_008789 [Prymnesium parvum]|uniref:DNA (cytosine-5-)-methyltransferase n=1 Tax=Prymnesium parvum TaxID=97485 RepID=A0AB34IUV4_PRYPA